MSENNSSEVNAGQSTIDASEASKVNTPSKKQKIIKEIKSITLIIVGVLAFRSIFFEPFKIPSGSMIPSLMIGDFILVNKFSYGFKVPFSDWFSDPVYITKEEHPKRGDVIVFKYPKDHSLNFIKRVVGLPGDKIEILDKVVHINGKPLEAQEFDGREIMKDMDDQFKTFPFKFFKVKTGDHEHTIQLNPDNMITNNHYEFTIPEGHFFCMGDNRDYSDDSRSWGFVPFKNIKGKAIFVWLSLSLPFLDNNKSVKFRPGRIGTIIN